MSRIAITFTLAATLGFGPSLAAQPGPGQGPPPNGRGMGPDAPPPAFASVLLARTGELKLTDQQVTRLAGIARQAAERRKANASAIDSLRNQEGRARAERPEDRPAAPPPAARALMERIRMQEHNDLRDALVVLTPDQLATAFEMSRPGRGAGQGGRGGGPLGMRPGMPGMPAGREPGAGPRNGPPNGQPNGGAPGGPGARRGPPGGTGQ